VCEREREREREKGGWGVVRETTVLVKDLFNFDLKDVGAAVVGEM
jgi:hypothetical protein